MYIGNFLAAAATALALSSPENIAVSQLGYHPSQPQKQAIVYTPATTGTFVVRDSKNKVVHNGTLFQPRNADGQVVPCQGGQPCLIADFSAVKAKGTYRVEVASVRSPSFPINRNILGAPAWKLNEPDEAFLQQGSDYHADYHKAENPPFNITVDGSYLFPTHIASVAVVRESRALEINPTLWKSDRHGQVNMPDAFESIRLKVKNLRQHQALDGDLAMSGGYLYNFGCAPDYDPVQGRYNTQRDPCLILDRTPSSRNTIDAAFAYASAIPVFHEYEGKAAAQDLLNHTVRTVNYIRSTYGTPSGQDAAGLGAALFVLSDVTGDAKYLREAHALRNTVPTNLDAVETLWNERYWEEYANHKGDIQQANLEYIVNGQAPEQIFIDKIEGDWSGGRHPISNTGENVFTLNMDIRFQNSRFMLTEALFAAEAMQYSSDPLFERVAARQLQWLTGMNSVQDGDGAGQSVSRSFIAGIGNNGRNYQHTRLVDPTFFASGRTFLNGAKFIPGWVSGAFDSERDVDNQFNYVDAWSAWQWTETTIEMIAEAKELMSRLDARYNGRVPLTRDINLRPAAATASEYEGFNMFPGFPFVQTEIPPFPESGSIF